MFLIRRLPGQRLELLYTLLVFTGFFAIVRLMLALHLNDLASILAILTLELILPLTAAALAAAALAGDPALDILLTVHRPAWQVLGERLLLTGLFCAILGSAALLLAQLWDLRLPREGLDQAFIWLSPVLFCMGFSSWGALLHGRVSDGLLLVLGVMGVSLLALSQIPQLCAQDASADACAWWLLSPLMTLAHPAGAFWPLNRLLWLSVGAAFLAFSLRLAQREEQLLHEPAAE